MVSRHGVAAPRGADNIAAGAGAGQERRHRRIGGGKEGAHGRHLSRVKRQQVSPSFPLAVSTPSLPQLASGQRRRAAPSGAAAAFSYASGASVPAFASPHLRKSENTNSLPAIVPRGGFHHGSGNGRDAHKAQAHPAQSLDALMTPGRIDRRRVLQPLAHKLGEEPLWESLPIEQRPRLRGVPQVENHIVPAMPSPGAPWARGDHWTRLLLRRPRVPGLVSAPSAPKQRSNTTELSDGSCRGAASTACKDEASRAISVSGIGEVAKFLEAAPKTLTTAIESEPKRADIYTKPFLRSSAALQEWASGLLAEQERERKANSRLAPLLEPPDAAAALLELSGLDGLPTRQETECQEKEMEANRCLATPLAAPDVAEVIESSNAVAVGDNPMESSGASAPSKPVLRPKPIRRRQSQPLESVTANAPGKLADGSAANNDFAMPETLDASGRGYVAQRMASLEQRALKAFGALSSAGEVSGDRLGAVLHKMGHSQPNQSWIENVVAEVCSGRYSLDRDDFCAFARAYEVKHSEHLWELFRRIDADESGTISGVEFLDLLREEGITALPGLLPELLDEVASNVEGPHCSKTAARCSYDELHEISFDQFAHVHELICERGCFPRTALEKLRDLFKRFDQNGDGGINVAQLRCIFKFDVCLGSDGVDVDLLERLDAYAKGGKVELDEADFLAVMRERRERGIEQVRNEFGKFQDNSTGLLPVGRLPDLVEVLRLPSALAEADAIQEALAAADLKGREQLIFEDAYVALEHYRDAYGLPRAELEKVKAAFAKFDENQSGGINGVEFGHFIRWLGYPSSYQIWLEAFEDNDFDSNNQLELDEVIPMIAKLLQAERVAIKDAFVRADEDHDGLVSVPALRRVLLSLSSKPPTDEGLTLEQESAKLVSKVFDFAARDESRIFSLEQDVEDISVEFATHLTEAADHLADELGELPIDEFKAFVSADNLSKKVSKYASDFFDWLTSAHAQNLKNQGSKVILVTELANASAAFLARQRERASMGNGAKLTEWDVVKLLKQYRKSVVNAMQERHGFNELEVKRLHTKFRKYDRDDTGRVAKGNLMQLLGELCKGEGSSLAIHDRAKELLQVGDSDNEGSIDFDDFLRMMRLMMDRVQSDQLDRDAKVMRDLELTTEEVKEYREIFRIFDCDTSEDVCMDELVTVLSQLIPNITQDDVHELRRRVAEVAADGKTSLDFPQFVRFMKRLQETDWRGLNAIVGNVAKRQSQVSEPTT